MTRIEDDIAAIQRIGAVPTILKVVSEITGLRLALVARVTHDSWTACATLDRMEFGLHVGDKLDVTTTLCKEVHDTQQPVIIEHATQEPAFCNHPTPKMYGFESYLAFPIYRKSGEYFGNLCALDSAPARLRDEKTIAMLTLFTELISLQLTAEEEHGRDRAALVYERRTAELREQFIAVLGHDLKTPLASLLGGAQFLLIGDMAPEQREVLEQMQKSAKRISRLVDDLLDFARGRLGEGIPISRDEVANVDDVVKQVVAEVSAGAPKSTIRVTSKVSGAANFDATRVAQLMSNLVANAVEHSPEGEPIDVVVNGTDDVIEFSVRNDGEPIPADVVPRLFQPFSHGGRLRSARGLGLGLFIASQIAQAHGGRIDFESTAANGTTFKATLPRRQLGDGSK